MDIPEVAENQSGEHNKTSYQLDEQLLWPIEDLNLSIRSLNCLKKIKVIFIRELIQKTEKELLSIPHLGRKSLFEIKERLLELGLYFGMQIEQAQTAPPDILESDQFSASVDILDLSVRSSNCLKIANIRSISELTEKTEKELLAISHFGNTSLLEIKEKLLALFPSIQCRLIPRYTIIRRTDEIKINSEDVLKKLNTSTKDLILSHRTRKCLKNNDSSFAPLRWDCGL